MGRDTLKKIEEIKYPPGHTKESWDKVAKGKRKFLKELGYDILDD